MRAPKLNPSQQAAVEHAQGPLLVLAGAGSGKTRVVTQRIARLIDRGVRPGAILAVTFTNKAAAEMGERVSLLAGAKAASKLWLSTFHSLGVRFLREEKGAVTGGRFVVFDQGDSLGLVRELLRRHQGGDRRLDAMAIVQRISLWKNAFIDPAEVPDSDFEYDVVAAELYPEYEDTLRSMRAVDFDDLVVLPARTLRDNGALRKRWQAKFRHVLVDEFQDTNRAQLELVKLLTGPRGNLCVVGDDDQSIYGWRGAEVQNILDFTRHFPKATVIKLEDNYRSTSAILAVANAAIAASKDRRLGKTLRAARGSGDRVRMCVVADTAAEAKLVSREIRDAAKLGRRHGEMAVLYRANQQSQAIEEELRALKVPYRVVGGTQFFDRKEVKDAAAYLRVLAHSRDELALRRILNYPPRGIGVTTIARLARHAAAREVPFVKALANAGHIDGLPTSALRGISTLLGHLESARAGLATKGLAGSAGQLFQDVGLRDALERDAGAAGQRRWHNVDHLVRTLGRYETADTGRGPPTLEGFLQRITLDPEEQPEESGNRVTLCTLHGAKGLEFGVVFVIGCVEGRLPHSRTTDPKITEAAPTDVEEERRLFYVGITRARDQLYLCRSRQATIRGRTSRLAPSRFLEALPKEAIEMYERQDQVPLETAETADIARALLDRLSSGS